MLGFLAILGMVSLWIHGRTVRRWSKAWRFAQSIEATMASEGLHSQSQLWGVVIPARNEANNLSALLDDLWQQLDQTNVNVIVVDDHSDDGTAQIAMQHAMAKSGRLTLLCNEGHGKKSALLTAIRKTDASWVVTLDADVRLGDRWEEAWSYAIHTAAADVGAIAGPVILAKNRADLGLWEGVQALDYAAQLGWSAGCLACGKPGSASGANMAVRCDTYPDTRAMGASGDDTLVVQVLQQQGSNVQWLATLDAVVQTQGALSMKEWIAQRLRWAGKAHHYPWHAKKTAWWMAWMATMQWAMIAGATILGNWQGWALTGMVWASVLGMNVWYAQPIATWFELRVSLKHWLTLGFGQPLQVPILVLSRMGVFELCGIPSQPEWKGRTCAT